MRRVEGGSPQGNLVANLRCFMSKTVLAVLATGLLSCELFCHQAGANQINGSVLFSGTAAASGDSGSGTTTISFTNPSWTVVSGLGNYSTFGTPAIFTAFSFTGTGTGATLSGPGVPQGTFTFGTPTLTFSFDLLALVSGTTTSGMMAISGTGIAHITGFDDMPASWALEGSGHDFTFDLSASTTPPAPGTPDGGSAASLLGIALVGLEALRRRLRSA
jgi:VPDSG-CTERM motif